MEQTKRRLRPEVNLERFQTITGTGRGVFYAFWLDLRGVRHNKIYGSKSVDGGQNWSKNFLVYASPEGPVCSCCQVSSVARNNDVYVMFRNSLGGARDLYVARSADAGATFAAPRKLGSGTWKLEACPMAAASRSPENPTPRKRFGGAIKPFTPRD